MYTAGELRLITSLENVIDDWLNLHAEDEDLVTAMGYVPDDTAAIMAQAALLLTFHSGNAQRFAIDNEFLAEV